jgi:cytochrome c553
MIRTALIRAVSTASFLTVLLLPFSVQAADEVAVGAKLVELRGCVTCHGKDGNGTDPTYPTLAGQYASYLEYSMKSYQNGARKHDLMKGYVKDLTDAEVKALAQYFSKQKSQLHDLRGVE